MTSKSEKVHGVNITCSADGARLDLAEKLLRRALCPSAEQGEAENAILKFVSHCRRNVVTFEQIAAALGRERIIEIEVPADDDPRDFIIGFGKWKGYTVGEVWLRDPAYLKWAAENLTTCDETLLDAIRDVVGCEHAEARA